MHSSTTGGRALAIIAGLAFASGGLTILLGPALLDPRAWTAYHILTILTVFGTIAAGHLVRPALSSRAYLSAAGFTLLFMTGTALVVYNSVGRQAEQHDTKALEAQARNSLIDDKRADIETARARQATAQANADRERGSKCKQRCRDWEEAAKDATRVITVLESEIKALGAPVPVDAKASKAGELAAVFGFDRHRAETIAAMIEPLLWTIFFEIGSIISLGFAFRAGVTPACTRRKPALNSRSFDERKAAATAQVEPSQLAELFAGEQPDPRPKAQVVELFGKVKRPDPNGSPDGSGGGGGRKVRRGDRKADVLADIQARIDLGERFESQEALRQALAPRFGNIPKSTLSEYLSDVERTISRHTEGRRKVIG